MPETSRRNFLSAAGAVATLSALPTEAAPLSGAIQLGICSYSFGKSDLAAAIPTIKISRTRYINIKPEFHLPYESSPAQINAMRRLLDDNGLVLAGTGTTYFLKPDLSEIRQRFEFNKALGSPLIVIGPTAETLPLIERFVKEYDIKVALHNHGPTDKHFPTPQSALAAMKDMDPRVGICMDVGHTVRSGVNPIEAARLAGPRLLDLHTKDMATVNGKLEAVDCGDGELDLAGLLRQLKAQGFRGSANLEHEALTSPTANLSIHRSLAYMRGLAAAI